MEKEIISFLQEENLPYLVGWLTAVTVLLLLFIIYLLVAVSSRSEEHSLNSSHSSISYAVFCLKKKNQARDSVLYRNIT